MAAPRKAATDARAYGTPATYLDTAMPPGPCDSSPRNRPQKCLDDSLCSSYRELVAGAVDAAGNIGYGGRNRTRAKRLFFLIVTGGMHADAKRCATNASTDPGGFARQPPAD